MNKFEAGGNKINIENASEDLRQIHAATMQILAETGMKFLHPEIIALLKKNGVRMEGETAYFSEKQILEWVGKAPSTFTIYAPNPEYDILVGGDNVECLPSYGSPHIIELDGSKRPASLRDYVEFLKLYEECVLFKGNGGLIVQPEDIPVHYSNAVMLCATLLYSGKCSVTASGKAEEVEALMDILGIVYGKEELVKKPRTITIVNTNSPLQLDGTMLDTMLGFVKHSQPIVIAACAMAGTTAPVTLAGTIALTNAEVLAGIAIAQMINPGTPVVYGSQSTNADMKTGSIASGSPEAALCYQYSARLAKAYGVPCRGGGTTTDAKSISIQAGYESMLTFLATHSAKTNLIIHAAGIMDGYGCVSYEKLIVDFEIIGMVRRYLNGVAVNQETLAVDVINKVGIAGQFLTQKHTMKNCRKESFLPDLSLRGAVVDDPVGKLMTNITNRKNKMLSQYKKPEMDAQIKDKLKKYLLEKGISTAALEALD